MRGRGAEGIEQRTVLHETDVVDSIRCRAVGVDDVRVQQVTQVHGGSPGCGAMTWSRTHCSADAGADLVPVAAERDVRADVGDDG